jgi:AraC family transcriptional regulator of adaptative response / DNA-3-methyladenine glycosylase II
VSVAAARTLLGRLTLACGAARTAPAGTLTHAFPTPEQVAAGDLRGIGLTTSRTATLRALATSVASGEVALDPTADRSEARAQLLALPGIGPWTVDYIAMRALGDPDAFPASDLVLRRMLGPGGAEQAERWRPWRAYAAMHLWNLATTKETT